MFSRLFARSSCSNTNRCVTVRGIRIKSSGGLDSFSARCKTFFLLFEDSAETSSVHLPMPLMCLCSIAALEMYTNDKFYLQYQDIVNQIWVASVMNTDKVFDNLEKLPPWEKLPFQKEKTLQEDVQRVIKRGPLFQTEPSAKTWKAPKKDGPPQLPPPPEDD